MTLTLSSKLKDQKLNITDAIIALMLFLSLLVGILPRTIVSFLIVALCAVLMVRDELYIAFPLIIFYNEWYGLLFGMSVSRWFSVLTVLLFIIRLVNGLKIKNIYFAPLLVYFFYSLFVITQYSVQRAIFSIVDVLCCVFLVSRYLVDSPDKLKKFFSVYAMVCVFAFASGILLGNTLVYASVPRFLSTFEDPNYMGYFYTLGVFPLIILKLFKPWLRYTLIALLYAVIFSSISLSAILVNVILWLVYFAIKRNIKTKTFIICILGIIALIIIYNFALAHPNLEIVGPLVKRIDNVMKDFSAGDVNTATTGRSGLILEHFNYYFNQSFGKILFGGTAVNTHYISRPFDAVAHNEYVDMLLNVGLVGTLVLIGFTAVNFMDYLRKYSKDKQEHYLCLVMVKSVWLIYCMSLTVLMDYRFMLPFFI